jgi:outer membrane protein OmpA-like peptidoglycan-associated protein
MKTTRPVFESFGAFVDFLKKDVINEMDFKGVLESLSGFFDADAAKAFESARLAYTKAPIFQSAIDTSNGILSSALADIDKRINDEIASNNEDKNGVQLSETTSTEIKTFTYDRLINGKVKLSSLGGDVSMFSKLTGLKDYFIAGKFVDINDLITRLNLYNLKFSNNSPGQGSGSDSKGNVWDYVGDGTFANDTGAHNMLLISSTAAGFAIGDNNDSTPDYSSNIIEALAFTNKNANKVTDNPVKITTVLYGVGKITQGAGLAIPDTLIKKEMTTTKVPGDVKEYETSISGDNKMFAQGKINIENKAGIDKAITAALSPLAGVPESILITGGASYEGDLGFNKTLVVERAKAVKDYMEGLYPQLKDKIKVAETDFSKIQTKDEPEKYTEFRKVYLKIKGVLQGDSYDYKKEITYTVDAPINADTVEIIQYAISREYTLPNFKLGKKKK